MYVLQEYRSKYVGCVPLHEQEHFSEMVLRMERDKLTIEEHLAKVGGLSGSFVA